MTVCCYEEKPNRSQRLQHKLAENTPEWPFQVLPANNIILVSHSVTAHRTSLQY